MIQLPQLTDGVQPQAVGAFTVNCVAGHTAVPAGVVAVDVGHIDNTAVALCDDRDVTTAGFMLPHVLDRSSPIFQIAAHPHCRSFHWRYFTQREVRLSDGDCIGGEETQCSVTGKIILQTEQSCKFPQAATLEIEHETRVKRGPTKARYNLFAMANFLLSPAFTYANFDYKTGAHHC